MSLMVSCFVLSFFHEMSWMRSGTELSQFLRIFLPAHRITLRVLHEPLSICVLPSFPFGLEGDTLTPLHSKLSAAGLYNSIV